VSSAVLGPQNILILLSSPLAAEKEKQDKTLNTLQEMGAKQEKMCPSI